MIPASASIFCSCPLRNIKKLETKHNIKDKVEMILEKERIILKPIDSPRKIGKKPLRKCLRIMTIPYFSMTYLRMKTLRNGIKTV